MIMAQSLVRCRSVVERSYFYVTRGDEENEERELKDINITGDVRDDSNVDTTLQHGQIEQEPEEPVAVFTTGETHDRRGLFVIEDSPDAVFGSFYAQKNDNYGKRGEQQ